MRRLHKVHKGIIGFIKKKLKFNEKFAMVIFMWFILNLIYNLCTIFFVVLDIIFITINIHENTDDQIRIIYGFHHRT